MFLSVIRRAGVLISVVVLGIAAFAADPKNPPPNPPRVEVSVDAHASEVIVVRDGKRYLVNLDAASVTEVSAAGVAESSSSQTAQSTQAEQQQVQQASSDANSKYYVIGDVRLVTLPTTKTLPRGGMLVEFTHRFPFQPAFSGPSLGHSLLGLDSFALPSFGFQYGLTNRLSVAVFRSPTVINRPIEFRSALKVASEQDGQPLNAVLRFSIQGLNDFTRDYTENFELITSKSLGRHAQLSVIPTYSIHNRPLVTGNTSESCSLTRANGFPNPVFQNVKPCSNTFSIGVGLAVDIRPTVALIAEVDPTASGGSELGIHHPPYAFGIQKKIWRHAFTFGFTTAPGATIAQRIGTRATLVQDPTADHASGLFIGFNLSRQLR